MSQFSSLCWVIPKTLAIGPMPILTDCSKLLEAGIKVVFSLCSESEGALPIAIKQDFKWVAIPLPDSHYKQPLQVEQLAEAVAQLNQLLEANQSTYIHCFAGIERSPTVCIAYLCLHKKMKLWAALNWLKQRYPRTSPTDDQLKTVRMLLRSNNPDQPDQ